jgi:hypothetical protein
MPFDYILPFGDDHEMPGINTAVVVTAVVTTLSSPGALARVQQMQPPVHWFSLPRIKFEFPVQAMSLGIYLREQFGHS